MRGHQPLIAMRLDGLRPDLVSIHTDPNPWSDWRTWPEWSDVPQIEVQPDDAVGRLDLRFVVGLVVMVAGSNCERVLALYDACLKAGAARVLAFAQRVNEQGLLEPVTTLDSGVSYG